MSYDYMSGSKDWQDMFVMWNPHFEDLDFPS